MRRNHILAAVSIAITFFLFLTIRNRRNASHESTNTAIVYEAPLRCYDGLHTPIPDSYTIILRPGHSMDDHMQAIGVAAAYAEYANMFVFPVGSDGKQRYSCEPLDGNALAAIRADVGVARVECNLDDGGEGDY